MAEKGIVYPPGVRELSDDITTDELVRRLKDCAQAFQNMSQDDDNSAYIPLAEHLVSEVFLEHASPDVQLLVACCIADIFRVYAPDAPYKDAFQLKVIFEFLVDQLRGLRDPLKPSFKRYFYLLENFACVKTFNLCVELEDTQKILCRLFKLMFKIINDNHSAKIRKFILDMLSPLIIEADVVSQELLDVILSQIIEPIKTKNPNACSLAQDILKRNVTALEPYIQSFFNNTLILEKTLESDLAYHLYELIYELNGICPSMLSVTLSQLDFKIQNNEEKERLEVTQLLGRIFSDKHSTMIEENQTLWNCFLTRFNDISPQVRRCCVQFCKSFLLNHPESRENIIDQLKIRHHDHYKIVRYETVTAIISTAKENFSCISKELLDILKERTRDTEFEIRKEALLGLAAVYKKLKSSNASPAEMELISWFKNKVLHAYYRTSLDDKFLVERILFTCLVPYQIDVKERMKLLYQLFCSVDDYAAKSFKEIMKCQSSLRSQMKSILETVQCIKHDTKQNCLAYKVSLLSKTLPDPVKSRVCLLKFCNDLHSNLKLRSLLSIILNGNISSSVAEQKVKEILSILGETKNKTYTLIIKRLIERIAPVVIDKCGIRHLVDYVKDSLLGDCSIEAELELQDSSRRGLELLLVLTSVYPCAFHDENIYNNLLLFLKVEDDVAVDMTLQIFMKISHDMEINFPEFSLFLLKDLECFVEAGTTKQAKHAVYCIYSIVSDKERVFENIIHNLKKHFTLQSQYFRTALVSVGHIAYLCHNMFAADLKNVVSQTVVKELLMLDQDLPRGGSDIWGPLDSLPDETKCKIEGMKVMVRWLLGLKNMTQPAISTLRLLSTVILNDGDLMERQHTAPIENSWMRLSAANCMLKLCQEPNYANVVSVDQFLSLAFVMNDKCPEVRDRFIQKLHKGLFSLKLPLEFLAIFSLAAFDEREEFHKRAKTYLTSNINKRKDYIKYRVLNNEQLRQFLPDYALPYAVYLLAHSPILKAFDDVPSLKKIKECLRLLMEPLMVKNENYNFSFFKRLLENIKQTKDIQASNSDVTDETNLKLYAVCDLALSIVMSETRSFVLKDFPVVPALPAKFYTETNPQNYNNLKTYLPPELIPAKMSQKSGIGIEIFEGLKIPSVSSSEIENKTSKINVSEDTDANLNVSQSECISSDSSKINENYTEVVSDVTTTRNTSKKRKKMTKHISNNTETVSTNDKNYSDESSNAENAETNLDSFNNSQEHLSDINGRKTELHNVKNLEVNLRLLRSSKFCSTRSIKHTKSTDLLVLEKQNGIIPSKMDIDTFADSDIQNSLKECNVSLWKDEVKKYMSLNSPDHPVVENSSNDDDFQQMSLRNKRKLNVTYVPVASKKRKRDDSPITIPVKMKSSSRIAEKLSNSSGSSSCKVLQKSRIAEKLSNNSPRSSKFKPVQKSRIAESLSNSSPESSRAKAVQKSGVAENLSNSSEYSKSKTVLKYRISEKISNNSPDSSKSKVVQKPNSSNFSKNYNNFKKGNKLSLINGSRENKVFQKASASHKYQKPQSPITRRQKAQEKLNLRKR